MLNFLGHNDAKGVMSYSLVKLGSVCSLISSHDASVLFLSRRLRYHFPILGNEPLARVTKGGKNAFTTISDEKISRQ